MRDYTPSPTVSVPSGLEQLESDYQRVIYVENRLKLVSVLKHDKLMLKDRFLSALTPPEVQGGFSQRINELSKELQYCKDQIDLLTSERNRLQSEQIKIVNVYEPREPDISYDREDIEISPSDQSESVLTSRGGRVLMAIVIFLFGAFTRFRCSSVSVESEPAGVEHSLKGGTTNGHDDQPQQGPSPQSQNNRRFQKNSS